MYVFMYTGAPSFVGSRFENLYLVATHKYFPIKILCKNIQVSCRKFCSSHPVVDLHHLSDFVNGDDNRITDDELEVEPCFLGPATVW